MKNVHFFLHIPYRALYFLLNS